MAAEHERVNNRDNKARKEQRFKQREVRSTLGLCLKHSSSPWPLSCECGGEFQEKKQLAASGKAYLEETGRMRIRTRLGCCWYSSGY